MNPNTAILHKSGLRPFETVQIIMLLGAVVVLFTDNLFGIRRSDFAITYVSITIEAFCFMLMGSVVSGLVEVFVPKSLIEKLMLRNRVAMVSGAAAMGFVFPVCECAIIPVVRRLLKKGMPLSAAIAFLLAAPIVNPVVIWSTFVAYRGDWVIAILRTILGFGIACIVGISAGTLFKPEQALAPSGNTGTDDTAGCSHHHGSCCGHTGQQEHGYKPVMERLTNALVHARDDFLEVGKYLMIGTFIAAIVRSGANTSVVETFAQNTLVAIPGMMFFAFILNLCSEADAFVAASFRGIIPASAQLAFLVFGPMLDIKLVLMYRSVFTRRFAVYLISLITITTLIYMLIVSAIMSRAGF